MWELFLFIIFKFDILFDLKYKRSIMGNEECFGKLYCLENVSQGKWISNIIERISSLHCIFGIQSPRKHNGIKIGYKVKWGLEDSEPLGKVIASFIVRSYITKRYRKVDPDGGELIYVIPINLVLSTIEREYTALINKHCIQSIISILNHPHFSGCTSIEEIEEGTRSVKDFNNRFTKD